MRDLYTIHAEIAARVSLVSSEQDPTGSWGVLVQERRPSCPQRAESLLLSARDITTVNVRYVSIYAAVEHNNRCIATLELPFSLKQKTVRPSLAVFLPCYGGHVLHSMVRLEHAPRPPEGVVPTWKSFIDVSVLTTPAASTHAKL